MQNIIDGLIILKEHGATKVYAEYEGIFVTDSDYLTEDVINQLIALDWYQIYTGMSLPFTADKYKQSELWFVDLPYR